MQQRNRNGRRFPRAYRRNYALILTAGAFLSIASCGERRNGDSTASHSSSPASLCTHLNRIERDLRSAKDGVLPARGNDGRPMLDSICLRFARECPPEKAGRPVAARSLASFIFDTLGIRFDTARVNIEAVLPASVARNRRGSCLGISALMLVIAESCGMPLHGVLVPGHFFVRFDDGKERVNVETMKAGQSMPDAWYAERFGVPEARGRYLDNLTKEQTAAVVRYNAGNAFLARKKYATAVAWYQKALSALPDFPDALGNYAIALAGLGRLDSAVAILSGLKAGYPDFKNIDVAMGNLWLKKGNPGTALRYFGFALERTPHDAPALLGAGISCFELHRFPEAQNYFRRAIAVRPDYHEARRALDKTVAVTRGKGR